MHSKLISRDHVSFYIFTQLPPPPPIQPKLHHIHPYTVDLLVINVHHVLLFMSPNLFFQIHEYSCYHSSFHVGGGMETLKTFLISPNAIQSILIFSHIISQSFFTDYSGNLLDLTTLNGVVAILTSRFQTIKNTFLASLRCLWRVVR